MVNDTWADDLSDTYDSEAFIKPIFKAIIEGLNHKIYSTLFSNQLSVALTQFFQIY